MTIYVGLDNTSNSESVGTAKFARRVAKKISDIISDLWCFKTPVLCTSRNKIFNIQLWCCYLFGL